ncbi:MAG: hypothetical protein GX657_02515 [Chloroflexi bacterium]|nr:hypothetical protein [Chloroflexota bacterium]
MADPHAVAVRLAERTNADLLALFARLGTADHPRGVVLSAYRMAHRALRGALGDRFTVDEVLAELRRLLGPALTAQLRRAYEQGQRQAAATLDAYGIEAIADTSPPAAVAEAERALGLVVEGQAQAVRASVAARIATEALLLGDDTRLGVLTPQPVVREGARWLTALAAAGFGAVVERSVPEPDTWRKQAIATVDERTTDCCLRVHGQVRPLDGAFHLVGTPRFADDLPGPPFHWHCRSVVALVQADEADDPLSQDMREAARLELAAREEQAAEVRALQERLVRLGAEPDARTRKDDSREVTALRRALLAAKRPREVHPSSATSRVA